MASAAISQPYQTTLVNYDMTNEETLLDVVHSLGHLSAVVNEVFSKIDGRIEAEKTRITYIKARVNVCQQKVQQIKGSNQAITVFSTAKYPAPKELPMYPTLLQESSVTHPTFRDIQDDAVYLPAQPQPSWLENKELETDMVAIYSRLNSHGRDIERVEFIMEDEGLGAVPLHVSSISSLLLFNSSVNVYKNYQTLDNLEHTGREKQLKDEAAKQLASAPATMVSGDALPDIQGLDLTFKPQLGEMSNLALPENLPLDFIANIQFTAVDLPSIAPSAYGRANYSLPQITDGGYSSGPSAKQSTSVKPSVSGPPPPPPPSSGGPPPPPPPSSSGPPPPPPPSSAGPPPPPPPAAAAPTMDAGPPAPPLPPSATLGGGEEASTPPADDGSSLPKPDARRASLLDSIKGMNVARLKKKDPVETERRPKKEPPKAMSMQDALRERLARRNEAISGKSDRDSQHRDSVIIREAAQKQKDTSSGSAAATAAASSSSSNSSSSSGAKAALSAMLMKKSALTSVGFASVDDGNAKGDDDSALPKMPLKPAPKRSDNSDSDSDSDSSIVSAKPKSSPIPPPIAPPVVAPRPVAPLPIVPPAGGKEDVLSSLLARASTMNKKEAHGSDSDEGDDDWD